jgi:hypothetical protein
VSQLLIAIAMLCQATASYGPNLSARSTLEQTSKHQLKCQKELLRCSWETNNKKRDLKKAEENLPWCVINRSVE